MSELNLQEAQVGVSLAINIFDEFFTELRNNDENLQSITFNDIDLTINQLRYVYEASITSSLLRIEAAIELLGSHSVVLEIRLPLELKPVTDSPPVLGLSYAGIHNIIVDEALEELFESLEDAVITSVDNLFNDNTPGSIGNQINSVQIDLVAKVVEGMEIIMFPDEDTRPAPADWEAELQYLPAENDQSMHAIAIFIATPGNSVATNAEFSFLNAKTGFGIIFNQDFLQDLFNQGAEDSVGTEKCGSTLDSLSLTLNEDHIQIEGSVSKSLVTIPFNGPGFPFLYRGTTEMSIDTSQVDADEPAGLSGFLKFLAILTAVILPFIGGAIFGLLGIIGGIVGDIWLVPSIWGASEDLDNADGSVQSGLAGALGAQLSELASGLVLEEDVQMITLESTPNQLRFINGHYLFDALIFVSPIEETITNGWFSKKIGRFVFHQLEGGQKFKTSELARLVKSGKITTPGFTAVQHANGRFFMRANPDNEAANNLQDMFRENPPDEPYPVNQNGDDDSDDC